MIHEREPIGFNPEFEVVSCVCEYEGKILVLLRQDNKREGNKWGLPAGKIDPDETPEVAMTREFFEETEYQIPNGSLKYVGQVFVRYPDLDFSFHTFVFQPQEPFNVKIRVTEHKDSQWIEKDRLFSLNLVQDLQEALQAVCEDFN